MKSTGIIVIVHHSRLHNRNRGSLTNRKCKYNSKLHLCRVKAIFAFTFLIFLCEKVRVLSHLRIVELKLLCELLVTARVRSTTVGSFHRCLSVNRGVLRPLIPGSFPGLWSQVPLFWVRDLWQDLGIPPPGTGCATSGMPHAVFRRRVYCT